MSALSRQPDSPLVVADWQPQVVQTLEEFHLAAWSDRPDRRARFAASLSQFLGAQRDTEVCSFFGRYILDIESFCHQLERGLPGPILRRRIDGIDGVTAMLRYRHSVRGRRASKFRYYVWNDADVLLRANRPLFGQLVDAMAGVAAEAEYVSDDLLLIHRSIFVGSADLHEYFEDEHGQFRSWWQDEFGEPFWRVVTGIDTPRFETCEIDDLDR